MKRKHIILLFGTALFIIIFIFSEDFMIGLRAGLSNCGEIVIPSLFPFLIASSLIGAGEMPSRLKKLLNPVTKHLFRLPADCFPALILGQLGGYLSGAKATKSLYKSGKISRSEACRMLLFSVNAGMGFSVNAIGNALLGSRDSGRIILASLCLSSVILGFFIKFFPDDSGTAEKITRNNSTFSVAVVESVISSAEAMLNACGFICIFSGLGAVINSLIENSNLKIIALCLLEVTSGCISASKSVSLPAICAVCAFGGLCIHMQIFSLAMDLKISIARFYMFRILHAVLSFFICRIILCFHPVEAQVFIGTPSAVEIWSYSAPAAVSLLFMCILLILDLDYKRKIC